MTLPPPRWLWVSGACLSLVAALFVGSNYKDWKTARLRKSAERAIEQQQPVKAALDAAAALQIAPGDAQLTRLLGDAYDTSNDERLLDVLAQQVALEPANVETRIRLARAALRFGRIDISAQTIAEMPAEAAAATEFHQISSALATIAKDGQRLLKHARELYRLDPANPEHLLKLGGLAVLAESFILRGEELTALKQLQQQRDTTTDASILLWGLSKLPGYPGDDAAQLENALIPALHHPGVEFQTRLHALDLAVATRSKPTASAILNLMMAESAKSRDRDEIAVLLAWMNRRDQPADALAWAQQLQLLSGDEKPAPAIASILAESCARGAAWKELEWIVTGSNWGRGEFIRNFYAAKCATERPTPTSELKRESFLRLASKETESNPAQLQLLWKLARKFGWRDLSAPLSWTLADRTRTLPERHAILQAISTEALAAGDLDDFRRATAALLSASPGQWELRNNAYYARLLQDGCDRELLGEIEGFQAEFSEHADVSTTYALALHLAGQNDAAVDILNDLPEKLRTSPAIAPFCALIFDSRRADAYRDLPHQLYFPQERQLFATITE